MTRRTQRPPLWRVFLLLALIGGALYVNQVVVSATPPLFIPTPTQSPESLVNLADGIFERGWQQGRAMSQDAIINLTLESAQLEHPSEVIEMDEQI